jgi:PadR family transcriptional regulator PadR
LEALPHYRKLPPGFSANDDYSLTDSYIALAYVAMKHMASQVFDREMKKGSAELLILSLIEHKARHGYEISKLIDERSGGVLKFNVASFYPLLYRLEERGLIAGRWVEKAGQRRRRYYRLTAQGKDVLKAQRATWLDFVNAIHRITEAENA